MLTLSWETYEHSWKKIFIISIIFFTNQLCFRWICCFPFSTFSQLSCIKVFTILLQTLIDKKDIDIWCLKTFLLTQTLFVSNWGISKCENCGDFATDIYRALTTLNFEGCKVINDSKNWKDKSPFCKFDIFGTYCRFRRCNFNGMWQCFQFWK